MGTAFPRGSYRLVVGMHPAVPAVIEELVKAECAVVLVADVDPVSLSDEVHLVRGDPTDPAVIRRARPAGAVHALVAAPSDGDVLVMTVLLREQAPELAISALCSSRPVREALKAVGVDQAVSVDELLSHMLAKSLETPHAGDLLLRLVDSERHRLVETEVESSAIGATLSAVRRDRHGLVLGIVHDGSVDLGIADDPTIAAGDHLLVAEPTARRSPASETP